MAVEGLHLILVARREPALASLAAELKQGHGVQCCVLSADLSDLEAVHRVADATSDLDVGLLVAAAGFGTSGLLLDSSLAAETEMVDLNCTGVLALASHLGPRLVKRGRGGVVFMSSLLAFHGTPRAANYVATKAYIQTLAEGLRVEWAALGVDVIASAPGPISSGFAGAQDHGAAGLAVQAAGVVTRDPAALGASHAHHAGDEGHDGPPGSNHRAHAKLNDRAERSQCIDARDDESLW